MNLHGLIQDRFPRVELALRARNDESVAFPFILDTAFDGEFALPADLIPSIYAFSPSVRRIVLANGMERDANYVMALLEREEDEPLVVEVLVMEAGGNPLLGIDMLAEHLVTIEMMEGGDVAVETL